MTNWSQNHINCFLIDFLFRLWSFFPPYISLFWGVGWITIERLQSDYCGIKQGETLPASLLILPIPIRCSLCSSWLGWSRTKARREKRLGACRGESSRSIQNYLQGELRFVDGWTAGGDLGRFPRWKELEPREKIGTLWQRKWPGWTERWTMATRLEAASQQIWSKALLVVFIIIFMQFSWRISRE